ncbi:MAG: hypothetical protein F9K16_06425 [Thermoanaerobaculia bacterium]|nr:MAG: hypothetical protein F9K16_06425 [Thermoanaerobaculia bacterium]MBZ0101249.1 hypothetical protein [Thermoanaerobaculia bacterium]
MRNIGNSLQKGWAGDDRIAANAPLHKLSGGQLESHDAGGRHEREGEQTGRNGSHRTLREIPDCGRIAAVFEE